MEALQEAISSTCPVAYSGVTGALFLRAMTTAITTHCLITDSDQWPEDHSKEVYNKSEGLEYDFIIVGAGTAGSLVASQLSNINPSLSVLLVEAGEDTGVDSEIPAFLFLNQNSKSDWFYKTNPDGKSCLGFKNKSCIWSKGKCMGGSSSINAMLYIRGHPSDYNEWQLLGNPGWGYNDLKTYFEKQEKIFNITDYLFPGYDYNWYEILDKSWSELGYKNYNYEGHESVIGTRKVRILTNNGKRVNTASVYLKNASNIKVIKNSHVEKVILSTTSKQAIGILVQNQLNSTVQINVKKDVILSAGSIGSPLILMRSGIGPSSHLRELGIDCIHNLPVGQNLQDHIIVPIFLKTKLHAVLDPRIFNLLLLQYVLTRSGPFANIGITDYMGFINTNDSQDGPDIQYHHTYFPKNDKLVLRTYLEGIGYEEEIVSEIESQNEKHDFLCIYPTLLFPKSKGDILLRKENHLWPKIRANYLSHKNDLASMLKSIKFVQNLALTNTFQNLGIEIIQLQIPGCLNTNFNSDTYWECYIRHMATTIYHPVGTAKMGSKGDKTAVVDNNLLVHGFTNLRVVDASIMPVIPRGNTMAATLALAQKAVDIIKKHYSSDIKDEL